MFIHTHKGAQGLKDSDAAPTSIAPAPAKAVPEALALLPRDSGSSSLRHLTDWGRIHPFWQGAMASN